MSITDRKCIPCTRKTPPLEAKTVQALLLLIPEWKWESSFFGNKVFLSRNIKVGNFSQAIDFVNKVAALAETEGHHPDIAIRNYNNISLELTTHAIKNLSDNDFIMAAKIDLIIDKLPKLQ